MKTKKLNVFIALAVGLLIAACGSKPKVIESEPMESAGPVGSFKSPTDIPAAHSVSSEEHQVKVEEALNTERYTYLNVTEDTDSFWIAIPRKEVEVGGTYYYKGGLLKRNFQSKEYNRVFDTVYLVSDVIPINSSGSASSEPPTKDQETDEPVEIEPAEGPIKISELLSDPDKYQGRMVKITGKCVKVNPMIMDRNWLHIQDGSGDSLDLTVTTSENVHLGAVVSLEGTIALNKDFGAGYRYDIIMEGAVLK